MNDAVNRLGALPGGVSRVTVGKRSAYFDWGGARWRVGRDLVVHRLVDDDYRRTHLAFCIEKVLRAAG